MNTMITIKNAGFKGSQMLSLIVRMSEHYFASMGAFAGKPPNSDEYLCHNFHCIHE